MPGGSDELKGKRLGERYVLVERIGQGGMATVWRAHDERLNRAVAVKVLDVAEPDDAFYFHREARAVAALQHRNIVQIHDYSGMGEVPPWVVLELIDGRNLAEVVSAVGPLPDWVILCIAAGVGTALAHAHEQGVMHRDVKPENVLLQNNGRVLLTDFGVAKAFANPEKLGVTVVVEETRLAGTPAFMAPEQLTGGVVGPPVDIFALAALLYHAATGASPFAANELMEVGRKIIEGDFIPLRTRRPGLPTALLDLVSQSLARNPAQRPTADRVVDRAETWILESRLGRPEPQLASWLRAPTGARSEVTAVTEVSTRVTGQDTTILGRAPAVEATQVSTAAGVARPVARRGARSTILVVGAIAALGIAAGVGLMLQRSSPAAPLASRPPGAAAPAIQVNPTVVVQPSSAASAAVVVSSSAPIEAVAAASVTTAADSPSAAAPAPADTPTRPTTEPARPREARPRAEPANDRPRPRPRAEPAETTVAPSQKPGIVEVRVVPWGKVYVDGTAQGVTPAVRELAVDPGRHRIEIEHPTFGKVVKRIEVRSGERLTLDIDLRPER